MTLALILAAGSGERLGADRPKALVELAGQPMLSWSIAALSRLEQIETIVLALPDGVQPPPAPPSASAGGGVPPIIAVTGGAVRSESVLLALGAAQGDPVLVHDAARPLLTAELAVQVLGALAEHPEAQAAIAAHPVTDTIKRVGEGMIVSETLDRSSLWAVQTPQVFRRSALEQALAVAPGELALATDDAWLVERTGGSVIVVPAPAENLKITVPTDLALAELLLDVRHQRDV
jgi:2-C-methyl-D-erythritol 4-phosphate cytidylyltransferase